MTTAAKPLRELQAGKPGQRFQRLHKQRQDSLHGGAKNAALLAAAIVALSDEGARSRLKQHRESQTREVLGTQLD